MVFLSHDDVIPVNSLHKGQWHRALMFSLICVWINGWVNSREAGDLRCYRTHYDVAVMAKRHHRLKSIRYRLNDKYTKHFIRRKTNQYVYKPFVCRLSMFHDMVQLTLYSLNMNMFPMDIQNICIWIVLQAQRFISRRINRLYKI